MQAGKRDQPIFFKVPTQTNNAGSLVTTYVDASGDSPPSPDWAFITMPRGREAFEAARTNVRETIRLCVVYRADVLNTWRLEWMGQLYNIIHADRSKRRENELWITAEAVGAL